ncbi:MAG TPA: DUF294 nucleotidyltransferase-like domain-containing protein [Egibacteraceae bacterium]|nr:DUF294 nucleotidyltransferase-like domain-containing protein [Egibacteraceae bacterium]
MEIVNTRRTVAADHEVPEEFEDVVEVLERCPAFAGVSRELLTTLSSQSEIVYIGEGEPLPPRVSARPLVIERGALLIRDEDGRTIDLVAEGEFHAPSPAERAEAVGSVLALVLTDDAIASAWSAPPLRLWARRGGAAVIDEQTAPVRTIMSAPPVTVAAQDSCRNAAERMRSRRISSLIVERGDGQAGIVTDRDLRSLVASGGSATAPVSDIASFPVRAVASSTPVFEALIVMLTDGIHHLAVREGGRIVGVVTSSDLLALNARSPLHLRKAIDRADTVDGVAAALGGAAEMAGALLAAGTTATDVGRVIAALTDRVDGRLLTLAQSELGPAPSPYGWIVFGSQARGEQTLHSDQDTGLVLPDGLSPAERDWFGELGRWMTEALVRCGYFRCPGGVMASEEEWRGDVAAWRRRFTQWISTPTEIHLRGAEIAFDVRTAAGELDATALLADTIAAAADHGVFLTRLASEAVGHRLPLGFRGRFAVERGGQHAGTFDVKRGALVPIADLARLYTLARRGMEVSTDDRLAASAAAGAISQDLAETLRAGYDLALRVRLEHHLRRRADGLDLDNHIDPRDLPALVRSQLREVFKATRTAQDTVRDRYRIQR